MYRYVEYGPPGHHYTRFTFFVTLGSVHLVSTEFVTFVDGIDEKERGLWILSVRFLKIWVQGD